MFDILNNNRLPQNPNPIEIKNSNDLWETSSMLDESNDI